jgi:hypothetical protein
MREAAALDAQDVLILCFQSYVVKTQPAQSNSVGV